MKTNYYFLILFYLTFPLIGWSQRGVDFTVSPDSANYFPTINQPLTAFPKGLGAPSLTARIILSISKFSTRLYGIKPIDSTDAEARKIRAFVSELLDTYAKYNIQKGNFKSVFLKKESVFGAELSKLPTTSKALKKPYSVRFGPTKRADFIAATGNTQFTFSGSCPATETCTSFAFSRDSSLVALYKAGQLTVRRSDTGCLAGTIADLTNPVYCFSEKQKTLYAASQSQPDTIKRMDETGELALLALPDTLNWKHYRIDQIRPDDSLFVVRRILKGQTTFVQVWNLMTGQPVVSTLFPYLVNECKIERKVSASQFLLAAYRVDSQSYELRFVGQVPTGQSVSAWTSVKEYHVDPTSNALVMLTADSTLRVVTTANPITVAHARYFAVRGNDLVYWQRLIDKGANTWAMYAYDLKTGVKATPQQEFWYDTDLRRDVPRLTIQDNRVCFDDRSNNTVNYVLLDRLRK